MHIMSANLHVESSGTGPPLVLLHGWGLSGAVWQPLVKKLSRHFTLYVVDLPGMGFSRPIEQFHLHSVAERIVEILPAHADVLGWSLGGHVAMRMALDYPDLVRRLVLVGATPCFVNKQNWDAAITADVFNSFSRSVNADYHHTMTQFLTLQCMGAKDARNTIKLLRNKFLERPVPTAQTLKKALNVLLEVDLREELEQLRKPALLIHGDRDTLVPVQAAHWMAQNMPVAYLRIVAGASHAPFLSHTEAFMESVIQFLEPSAV